MNWIEPKINWKNGDFFNHIDYNRITGDIDYIREMLSLESLFTPKSVDGYMRVSEYNAITHELKRIFETNDFSFDFVNIADRNAYSSPWNAIQLNDIENIIRLMYIELRGEVSNIVAENKTNNIVSEDKIYNIYSEQGE